MHATRGLSTLFFLIFLAATTVTSQAQLIWAVGKDDNGWPQGDGGGPNTSFVQENGSINDLPGSPESTEVSHGADNDYYFAGIYTNTISSVVTNYGDYTPVGVVAANEEAAERAFAAADNDLRYHFNLPTSLKTNDLLSITFDSNNLDDPSDVNTDPRYGIEVYFNSILVQTQIVIRPAQLDIDYTTPLFSLASVNAKTGPGFDNIVSLKGINYNSDGGGNWMGIDYVQLHVAPTNAPPPPFLLTVGKDDDGWPAGTGGGANTSFVQENGTINPLPGSPTSTSVAHGADNDYYFAGVYTNVISSVTDAYGTYTPVGVVSVNEEAAERAFAADDNDLRYHFNLPSTLRPFDLISVRFDANNLDDPSDVNTDPRYGVEVYINGVLVQPQILVRPVDLGTDYASPQVRLDSVNAQTGPGFDNIVSLRGINYNAEGGGNWMGIDYVQVNAGASAVVDTNAPTVVSVTRFGDLARLKVTFSEPVTAATANVISNYTLAGGEAITGAVLDPDGKSVILTTGSIPIGTTNTLMVTGVKDLAGNPIASPGNQVNFTSKYQVLFVTADPGPLTFAGDQAVLQHLQARGFDVALSSAVGTPADGSSASGKDLIIISSSLTSGDLVVAGRGAKFMRTPVPVIEWEASLQDDFSFQAANGTTTTNQTQINIVNPNHPLAAGFPAGLLTVVSSPQTFSQGTPVGAHIIATLATDNSQALLYYYDKGELGYTNFIMPARRVFFFLQDNTATAATAAGIKLFDAAIDWSIAVQPTGGTNAPTLPLLWAVGMDDNSWPLGDGGGANASFVQENGSINPLPGSPESTEVPQGADNDYYFAGAYTTTISSVTNRYGDYTPVGDVTVDEEAAERAFAGDDNDLRYHFNLPTSLKPTDVMTVTFDANNLDNRTVNPDPRYGIEIFFNGILVQPEIVIRPEQLDIDYTTQPFTLARVNAVTGPGADNIVSLRGISYSGDGGGAWMGIDYVNLNGGTPTVTETLAFMAPAVSNGRITLNWTGTGNLESAPSLSGPWTAITPAPTPPYSEAILPTQNRFYRLRKP